MKTKKVKPYHLLVYIEDCSTKIKKFASTDDMGKFIDDFYKKYPNYADLGSDNWVDYAVTNVTGEVHFFTDGVGVE